MPPRNYLNQINALIEQYALADFVLNSELTIEPRRELQYYLRGQLIFQDESGLYFTEYLDFFEGQLDKLMYTYHYQDVHAQLIFRYDNANHKPPLVFITHKHLPDKIIPAAVPTLNDVLIEIVELNNW